MRASFGIVFALVVASASVDAATTGGLRGVNEVGTETRRLDQMEGSGSTADGNEAGKDLQERNNYGKTITECHFGYCWTYDATAYEFGIGREGDIQKATLCMPSYIQKAILAAVYPVEDLLNKIAPAISNISIDYPDMFEMLCLNRFQELFQKKACPRDALPGFFTNEQLFGQCRGVQFEVRSYRMPKITKKSAKCKSPSLASATAHPDQVDSVMSKIDRLRGRRGSASLKPGPQSASPDILLSTNVQLSSSVSDTMQDTVLTVGLAVKNYAKSTVIPSIVDAERVKFDRLFKKNDGCLNVLFICATNYGSDRRNWFSGAKSVLYTEEMQSKKTEVKIKCIHEVILLNLTTPQYRAEFFGLTLGSALHTCLEEVILKVPMNDVNTASSDED